MNSNSSLLIYKLIREMGLDITDNNIVIDQDFKNVLYFNNRVLKYNYMVSIRNQIDINTEIYFDPLNNKSLMNFLFVYYLRKLSILDNYHVSAYYTVDSMVDYNKKAIETKNGLNVIRSNYYYKDTLRYIDMILRLSGEPIINLSQYDTQQNIFV